MEQNDNLLNNGQVIKVAMWLENFKGNNLLVDNGTDRKIILIYKYGLQHCNR